MKNNQITDIKLKTVFFDVDGTIANTEMEGHREAFNHAFMKKDLSWHWDKDLYKNLLQITGGKERIRYFIDHFLKPEDIPRAADSLIKELHEIKTASYIEFCQQGKISLRPGIQRLFREIYNDPDMEMAIVTTTSVINVEALLEGSLGLESLVWFECLAGGDVVPRKKPAPDIYLYALNEMDLQPEETVAIEDSENGMKASLAAGIPVIITLNDITKDQNFSGATSVITSLGDPGESFQCIRGNCHGKEYVDLPLLQQWVQGAHQPPTL
jgi:beta-phosphoglucomutase-like phosphatase (HAD superfamily)